MPEVAEAYGDFFGGQLSSVPSNELNSNQLSLCRNAYVSRRDNPGILTKRKGYSLHWDESGTYSAVIAIHNFLQADGTEELLFAVEDGGNTEIRKRTGATSSTLLHTFTGTGLVVTIFTSSTDFAIFAAEDNAYQRYDGTVVTTLNAPTDMDTGIAVRHDGRIWGSDKVLPNKIHFSAVSNEDDFTTLDNSGFLTMKFPSITAMIGIGTAGLIVCGENETILIEGTGFQTYRQTELSMIIGCKSNKSMVSFGNFALFMSHEGVMSISDAGMEKISLGVEDIVDGLTDQQLRDTVAFRHKEFYILLFDSTGDNVNDSAIVFDTRFGPWVEFTNHPFTEGTIDRGQDTFVAGNGVGKIYKYDDGTTDDGTDIAMSIITRGMDYGRFFSRKVPRRIWFQSNKPGSTTNITVTPRIDGVDGSPLTYDINRGEGNISLPTIDVGQVLQLKIENSGTNDVVELRSLVLLAIDRPAGELP